MGKPILYAAELSPAVRGVLLVARAMDFELEIRHVNLEAGEHLKPEFLKVRYTHTHTEGDGTNTHLQMNPQHTVPTLDDNGFILWESHAICTYLIDRYARDDSLYPKQLPVRARINQRLHFNSSILFTRARPCTEAVLYRNATEFPLAGINEIRSAYDFMEAFLRDAPFFGGVGAAITVADYCLVATFSTTQIAAPLDAGRHPRLAAWFGRMRALPFYDEVNGRRNEQFRQFLLAKIAANRRTAERK